VLQNKPANVQNLSITHGFNTLTIVRAREFGKIILRAGAGAVLAHCESTIGNVAFNENDGLLGLGYYLTGPVVMGSVARPLRIFDWFVINTEGTMTVGYANVPVVDGRAKMLHLAIHVNAGPGFRVNGRPVVPKN
jgi:hypothetical protein